MLFLGRHHGAPRKVKGEVPSETSAVCLPQSGMVGDPTSGVNVKARNENSKHVLGKTIESVDSRTINSAAGTNIVSAHGVSSENDGLRKGGGWEEA